MKLRTSVLTFALPFALMAGCTLTQLTPSARFSESVHQLNDMARWGQNDMALASVSPKYKSDFSARHRDWGESVNIAEIELVNQQLAPDKESGISLIAFSWTDQSGVMLRKSFVAQSWANEKGSFRLIGETIKKGDPNLFAAMPSEETSGSN